MKTSTWRSKFQTDAENVKFTTRLTSLLINRFFLHVWLSLKVLWRYGLLKALLLLPLLIIRTLFFPLQWPISFVGNAVVSFCRWITDKPLMTAGRVLRAIVTIPIQVVTDIGKNAQLQACDAGKRCCQQYRELRELGFVNAMALMPFLIMRLIQGAVLTLFAAIVGVLRLCWKGISACGSASMKALLWCGSFFSLSGSWNWIKTFVAVLISRVATSPFVLWIRSVFAGSGQFLHSLFGRSISLPGWPDSARWSSLTRSFREQTAWVVVTITGTLGLILLLYFQWTTASAGQPAQNVNVAINAQGPNDPSPTDDASPIGTDQQEPSVWSGNDELQPFASFAETSQTEPTPDPQPRTAPQIDPLERADLPPTHAADEETTTVNVDEPAKRIFNPFTDLRPQTPKNTAPAQARVTEPEVEEPAADLELSVSWLPPGISFDESPDNQFIVNTQPAPLDVALAGEDANDGWREFDPTNIKPVGHPAAARRHLDLPELVVPSANAERELQPTEVKSAKKDLDLAISREFPENATLDGLVSYRIQIHNRGSKTVDRVMVEDRLPQGSRVVQTSPNGSLVDGKLTWQLGALQPDEERSLQVDVIPTAIGSTENVVVIRPVAAVVAHTQVSESVAPTLQLKVAAPFRVATGDDCDIQFQVTNPGEQTVDNVILRATLPNGLQHHDGNRLDYRLGSLRAGETRFIRLETLARKGGKGQCQFHLLSDNQVVQTSLATIQTIKASTPSRASRSEINRSSRPCCCRP